MVVTFGWSLPLFWEVGVGGSLHWDGRYLFFGGWGWGLRYIGMVTTSFSGRVGESLLLGFF